MPNTGLLRVGPLPRDEAVAADVAQPHRIGPFPIGEASLPDSLVSRTIVDLTRWLDRDRSRTILIVGGHDGRSMRAGRTNHELAIARATYVRDLIRGTAGARIGSVELVPLSGGDDALAADARSVVLIGVPASIAGAGNDDAASP